MDKVTDFLERYVQWVAVAIAVLFLGYAAWSYLPGVNSPVTVNVNGQPLPPAEAATEIQRTVAQDVIADIESSARVEPINVPDFSSQTQARIQKPTTLPTVPISAIAARPIELPTGLNFNVRSTAGDAGVTKVQALPVLPAATLTPDPRTGFAQVRLATSSTPAAATAAAPTATGAVSAPGETKDVVWVRVPFLISQQGLATAFNRVNLPPEWNKTAILHVELLRQKQLADGNWSPEEVVAALPTVTLQQLPANNAPLQAKVAYNTWAAAHQTDLLQPPFFEIAAGDNPAIQPAATEPEAETTAFDPAEYPPGRSLAGLKPEQIRQVNEHRRQAEADRRSNQGGGNRVQPGNRPPRGPGGPRQGNPRDAANRPAEPMPAPTPAAPAQTPGTPITLAAPPTAPFDPSTSTGDIQGVAYDITGISESTYRYRIRYSASNPIFGSKNVAEPETLAQQLQLIGEDPETWTTPVRIAPLTHIFVAQALNGRTPAAPVRFNVFRWQEGRWQSTTLSAASGDGIGKVDGEVDYRTPWTVVEVRNDSSSPNPYVLLMNSDGTLRRQEFDRDSNDPLQKRLDGQVRATTPTPAAGAEPKNDEGTAAPPANPARRS